jgi:hypothetical protein
MKTLDQLQKKNKENTKAKIHQEKSKVEEA